MCAWGSGRLHLDLQSGLGCNLATLKVNESVDHVMVRKSMSFVTSGARVSDQEEWDILEAVGQLPKLTRLDIVDFENEALSIKGLALTLARGSNLSCLQLDSVGIAGNEEDFDLLQAILNDHPSLSEVHFIGCFSSSSSSRSSSMDALAMILAQCQHLKIVEIVESRLMTTRTWTGRSLAMLCRSPSLKTLRVKGIRFLYDDQVAILAHELEQNNTALTELNLMCDIDASGVTAICQMLRSNTRLQILGLNCVKDGTHSQDIAEALRDNTTLRELELYFQQGHIEQIRGCFEDVLETNYDLERIAGGWTSPTIELLLHMNRVGRGHLMVNGNAPKEEWIKGVLAEHKELALSSSFYLLSQNPSFCSTGAAVP